ncbi:MAG: DUF58 domain-containing protein [Verrucomicrobiae bacterium]|nr:DUF58 domain-containing protein [Verrucomicrobiae bacterium]NNJ42150.1 DUF58 domain-containing protein [Akkermansiaceae bacterium]
MTPESIDEIMRRVHLLEIKARRLARETFGGEYQSSFKGSGLDFEDYREYQHGDETRFIDWNVTARKDHPYIRTFREERELSVILAVDVSGSSRYGSKQLSKRELAAELAAVIAFSANFNGDKTGLLLFANEPLLYLPPAKGSKHILRMIREILAADPEDPRTSIPAACHFLLHTVKRKALVFMISDFLAHDLHRPLGSVASKHDTIALRVVDPMEETLPQVGTVTLTDPETGQQTTVNTRNSNLRMGFRKLTRRHNEGITQLFHQHGIDHLKLRTNGDYLPHLHRLFKSRTHRRHH